MGGGGGADEGEYLIGWATWPQTSPTFQKLAELVAKMDMKMFGD